MLCCIILSRLKFVKICDFGVLCCVILSRLKFVKNCDFGVLCYVILSKLKFVKSCEKLPNYIGFDMSLRPNRSNVVHNIS